MVMWELILAFKKSLREKYSLIHSDYTNYLRSKKYGFSKLLIGNKYLTSKFIYEFLEYRKTDGDFGNQHLFHLTEILNLSKKNFANFEIKYSSQNEKSFIKNNITELSLKLNYFFFQTFIQ